MKTEAETHPQAKAHQGCWPSPEARRDVDRSSLSRSGPGLQQDSTPWPPELQDNKFLLFKPFGLWVFYYSSPSKSMPGISERFTYHALLPVQQLNVPEANKLHKKKGYFGSQFEGFRPQLFGHIAFESGVRQ